MSAESFSPIDIHHFLHLQNVAVSTYRCHLSKALASFNASIVWLAQSLADIPPGNMINRLSVRMLTYADAGHGASWDISYFSSVMKDTDWEQLDATLSRPQLRAFRGITFRFCIALHDVYVDLTALVRARLPKTRKLNKLYFENQ